ncbi:MAG: phosphatase PAP2 family protein [Clostridia bacterium]|nr:phosphatase PAP2 family protein [Clostridia bacterium]
MESNFAKWLDVAFAGFDGSILEFYHRLAEWCGALLSPLMELISFTGDKGLVLLLTALCLGLFSKTRKTGICMFGAICCGALITNIILKETICRVRPYEAQEAFRAFWSFVGAHAESEFSFPSGHTTAAAAAATGLWLTRGKKYLAISIPYVALMAASRNYFMVHYPTDVIAGAIVGTLAGVIAYFITLGIYRVLIKYENTKFCRFVLDFDVIGSFKRKK